MLNNILPSLTTNLSLLCSKSLPTRPKPKLKMIILFMSTPFRPQIAHSATPIGLKSRIFPWLCLLLSSCSYIIMSSVKFGA